MSRIQRADLALERGPVRSQDVLEDVHDREFNRRLAVSIGNAVGTMYCFYGFCFIGVGAFVGAVTGNVLLALTFGAVSSSFLQLVTLPILAINQNVQQAHADARSEQDHALLGGLHEKVDRMEARQERMDAKLDCLLTPP